MLPEGIGFKVKVLDRAEVIQDAAKAFMWAAAHRTELAVLGREARRYAIEKHDWSRIGDAIDAAYREMAAEQNVVAHREAS